MADVKVDVKVDVTKIVKYMCLAGVAIVAVIFGCSLSRTAIIADKDCQN